MGKIVTKSVDMNANILYLKHEIVADTSKTQARIEFRNMAYGTITAVKFEARGYNAFGDEIQIAGKNTFDIVAQDLIIAPKKYAKLDSVLPSKDIRKLDLKLKQVCYANGKIVNVQPEEIVTYEIEELEGVKGQLEYEAKNILEKKTAEAKCFPKRYGRDWICICGYLNKNTDAICKKCGCKQVELFETCTKEAVAEAIKERKEQERRKRAEEEARLEAERVQWEEEQQKKLEQEEKRKNKGFLIVGGSIIGICLVVIIAGLLYRGKYGLSKEDQQKYEIARQNYRDIEWFCLKLGGDYTEKAEKYFETNSDADEKKQEYIESRELYLESAELYDLIDNKYPEKYQKLYRNLANLKRREIVCDVDINSAEYTGNTSTQYSLEDKKAIEDEIQRLEEYLRKDVLNPDKIEYEAIPLIDVNSYTVNHKMGIVFFEDGQIRYIGEYKDDLANGYGKLWEENENGERVEKYEGQFIDGKIVRES